MENMRTEIYFSADIGYRFIFLCIRNVPAGIFIYFEYEVICCFWQVTCHNSLHTT